VQASPLFLAVVTADAQGTVSVFDRSGLTDTIHLGAAKSGPRHVVFTPDRAD